MNIVYKENKFNLISFYLIITYFTTILLTKPTPQIESIRFYIWIIPFAIWAITFIFSYKKFLQLYSLNFRTHKILFYYLGTLLITLVICTFYAYDPLYSLGSSIFCVLLLFIMFISLFTYFFELNFNDNKKKMVSLSFLTIMIIAILGELFIPTWNWDSTLRLSGGVNPNMMSLIALVSIIWFFEGKIDKRNLFINNFGLLISLLVLFWTMSRGRISGLIIIFSYYYFILFMFNLIKNNNFKKNEVLYKIMFTIVLLLLSIPIIFLLLNNNEVMNRFTTDINSRENAWLILYSYFKENIVFGYAGWWKANELLSLYGTKFSADSAHNLYIRLLAEVGILGLVVILLGPLSIVLVSLKNIFCESIQNIIDVKKMILYSGSVVGLFLTQFTEDQYMNGIGDFETGIFMFIIVRSYFFMNQKGASQ